MKTEITFNEEKHEYYFHGIKIPSVHEIMRHGRFIPEWLPEEDILRRGKVVHWLTEVFDKKRNYELVPPELTPYLQGYEAFLEEKNPKVLRSEQIVFHRGLLYAGTFDRLYGIGGEIYLVDIKTGGYSKWHKMQVTAYSQVIFDNNGEDGPIGAALYLTPNGLYEFKEFQPKYFKEFQAACVTYWFKRETDYNRITKLLEVNDDKL